MKDSLLKKLQILCERYEELGLLLGSQEIILDQEKFRLLSIEYSELEPVVVAYRQYQDNQDQLVQSQSLLKDEDSEIRSYAEQEYKSALQIQQELELTLQRQLLPKDPNDRCNVFLEIRAGTGGHEAALFAGDLYRMYYRYAESKRWQVELISESLGEQGGYKEIIVRIIGQGVYSQLKFESGAHRVQRVPTTESQGRIHTSACTVAILPEVAQIEEFTINATDLRIDTYRASGAGGQHVNRTDSAVRITHIPTGVVAECQEERSQHKNKAKAMSLLQAKLLTKEQTKQQQEQAQTRRDLVGSGDRSERIRTYNFPQGRVTDHRINLTLYKLAEIIEGALDCVIEPLIQEHQTDLLAALSQ